MRSIVSTLVLPYNFLQSHLNGVERIQVNVIKETVNQPTRELKLDENGMLAIRLPDGSVVRGTPVDLFNSDNDPFL